jgi:FkbM family methyltransferase
MLISNLHQESTQRLGEYLIEVLRMLQINCVLDVGAWRGDYGKFLRRIGYQGRIISFEPIKEVYSATRKLADADSQWSIHNLALGSEDTIRDFNVSASSDMSSFLDKSEYSPAPIGATDIIRVEKVEVSRLDSIFERFTSDICGTRTFLKMDTQGYDLEVVRGAKGCLQMILGLQSELSVLPLYHGMPNYVDVLREYHELGFNLIGFFDVLRDSRTLNLVEQDCIMVRNFCRTQDN